MDQKNSNSTAAPTFEWTKDSLLKMQISPNLLKEMDFYGAGGKSLVQDSTDPELTQYFATAVLPESCLPLSAILNGSPTLGDKFLLTQQSNTSSFFGNTFYQFVRVFPTESMAKEKMSALIKVAKDCGSYTRLRSTAESDNWDLWNRVEEMDSDSFIARGYGGTFGVGRIGSVTYFQWAIYDETSDVDTKQRLVNASKLKETIESLLTERQGM